MFKSLLRLVLVSMVAVSVNAMASESDRRNFNHQCTVTVGSESFDISLNASVAYESDSEVGVSRYLRGGATFSINVGAVRFSKDLVLDDVSESSTQTELVFHTYRRRFRYERNITSTLIVRLNKNNLANSWASYQERGQAEASLGRAICH